MLTTPPLALPTSARSCETHTHTHACTQRTIQRAKRLSAPLVHHPTSSPLLSSPPLSSPPCHALTPVRSNLFALRGSPSVFCPLFSLKLLVRSCFRVSHLPDDHLCFSIRDRTGRDLLCRVLANIIYPTGHGYPASSELFFLG